MTQKNTILDLFSGIGGFSYAAEQLVGGFQTVAFCEPNEPCQRVLKKHWPNTPIFPDVRTLQAGAIKELCPNGLSLITAGFPCQDLSCAGKQLGYNGERSVLFYEIIRLARELQPNFLLLENVRNLLSHQNGETFQETLFQIAKAGYDAEWAVIPASDLGACHRRERIWIVCYKHASHSNDFRSPGQDIPLSSVRGDNEGGEIKLGYRSGAWAQQWTHWGSRRKSLNPDWRSYVSQPVLYRGDDGLSNRVDRLKQLGNSIVPQVAAVPLQRIKDLMEQNGGQ